LGGLFTLTTVIAGLVGALMPNRVARFRHELQKRQKTFGDAFSATTAIDRTSVETLLSLQKTLGLTDEEAGPRTAFLHGSLELFDLEDEATANDGLLPKVAEHERIVAPGACFFASPCFLGKRGPDEQSQLFVTNARFVFLGSTLTSIPFAKIATMNQDGYSIVVQRNDRQTPFRFVFESVGTAMKARFIAANAMASTAGV
jgi:hypothetical protein